MLDTPSLLGWHDEGLGDAGEVIQIAERQHLGSVTLDGLWKAVNNRTSVGSEIDASQRMKSEIYYVAFLENNPQLHNFSSW